MRSGKPTPVFFTIKPTRVDPISINVRIDEKKQRNIYDEVFKDLLVKVSYMLPIFDELIFPSLLLG